MGTRSLTHVIDDEQQIVCMYRQFDGYPSGHGKELAEFLTGIKMVNGITRDDEKQRIANGAGCLAAQIVEHFKRENGAGGIYLMPFDVNAGQEYIYKVKVSNLKITVEVLDAYSGDTLFNGNVNKLSEFCTEKSEA